MAKTTIGDITSYLEAIAPPRLQESYDNSGLLVGHHGVEVDGVLISLDCIESVIDEAIDLGCNLVVCHHPIIFRGLKRLNGKNYIERTIMMAIKHDIAIYAIHTNLDNVLDRGVNQRIAEMLELQDVEILKVKEGFSSEDNIGAGVVGFLTDEVAPVDFLNYLKENMELETVKHTEFISDSIQKIAICGGSGGFLLEDAKRKGADVFITSDYKYHEFFDANEEITIVDIGHYESEKFTIDLLYELISEKFANFAAHKTSVDTNPISYY